MTRAHESALFDIRGVQELRKLVSMGESDHLEFKRKATYPEKIIREMIAFANTKGGTLLVGVEDNGAIPGLKHPEEESYAIQSVLHKCKPALQVQENFIPVSKSKSVICYTVPESKKKLHYFLSSDGIKESYVRVGDQCIKASREVREIVRRSQKSKGIRFHYGEHEHFLIKYLDTNATITLKKFITLSNLNKYQASKKLILLVLANVLRITPHEKGDLYSLAFSY